jgi:hypothetical protein
VGIGLSRTKLADEEPPYWVKRNDPDEGFIQQAGTRVTIGFLR